MVSFFLIAEIYKKFSKLGINFRVNTMQHIFKISILLLIVLVFNSCTSTDKVEEPDVKIISPSTNELYILPDTIIISLEIEHSQEIEYIRSSIVNKNMIPISEQNYIYTSENKFIGDIYLIMNIIPDNSNLPPLYIHLVVSDFKQEHHYYQEIELYNNDVQFKGLYLIGKNSINRLDIVYYSSQFVIESEFEVEGEYSASDISSSTELLYLVTSIPDKTRAYNWDSNLPKWTKDPQLPYPEIMGIINNENTIYLSTAIGRIIGLNATSGQQIFTTEVSQDSIPNNICITEDFIVTNFHRRNSSKKVWGSYYKLTGSKYQVLSTEYESISIYNYNDESNKVLFFCNGQNSGHIILFDVYNNRIEKIVTKTDFKIELTCKLDSNRYIFTSNGSINIFNSINNITEDIYETNEIIVDIKFDPTYNRLFVTFTNRVDIFDLSTMQILKSLDSDYPLMAIELLGEY